MLLLVFKSLAGFRCNCSKEDCEYCEGMMTDCEGMLRKVLASLDVMLDCLTVWTECITGFTLHQVLVFNILRFMGTPDLKDGEDLEKNVALYVMDITRSLID